MRRVFEEEREGRKGGLCVCGRGEGQGKGGGGGGGVSTRASFHGHTNAPW